MVCVVYRVWYVWCWGGVAVFFFVVALLVECGDGSGSRSGRQRILLLHFSRENRREIILRREIKMSCVKK